MSELLPFSWINGAAWLRCGGEIEIIPGFHEEWIKKNQDRVPSCNSVVDVILKYKWLSVIVYSNGYVEFMISSKSDPQVVHLCVEHLRKNIDKWNKALIMTMDCEGYKKISVSDFAEGKSPEAIISS